MCLQPVTSGLKLLGDCTVQKSRQHRRLLLPLHLAAPVWSLDNSQIAVFIEEEDVVSEYDPSSHTRRPEVMTGHQGPGGEEEEAVVLN